MRKMVLPILPLLLLIFHPFGSTIEALSPLLLLKEKQIDQSFNRKNIEKKLGRKLKLKERIAFWVVKKKLKKKLKQLPQEELKTPATASLSILFGIFGLVPVWGILFALLALFLGLGALQKINRNKELYKGRGLAIAGVVLGLLGIASFGLILMLLAVL